MAEFPEDIVYRKCRDNVSWSMANDDSALVKAYEDALKSFRESNGEEQVEEREDDKKEQWKSGRERKQTDEGRPARQQWAVGSRCRAVWSEDGLLYPAALVWVEGDRGRVRFDGYGNEEDVDLGALLPERCEQPWREKQQWVLGSRCRAVWSEDGLVYPAVLVWKKGERGRVQFEGYGNEEEVELSALLPPDEQEWRTKAAVEESVNSSSSSDWRKKEKKQHYTRKEDATITLSSGHSAGGEVSSCSDPGKEQKEREKTSSWREGKQGIFLPSSGPFPFLPPESPPPESATGIQTLPLLPPPPPPCMWPPKAGDEDGGDGLDSDMAALSSMLLSWYLCGYHTGCYMAMQQAKADHERADTEKHRVNYKYGRCTQ
ncbi:hypothetical protein MATL_G00027750 [Megalops atlanticus]|uniref:Tudor domain-containing protein n=1 Tax=Megalops atlanticus TaxID=7932 RepID=A0A9D3QEF0_MEGAT|nr:hypothetical protein MATL_G00027750 [Megalops atlanticus]